VVAGRRAARVAHERRLAVSVEQAREHRVGGAQVGEGVARYGCPSTAPGTPVFVE
jgi:hypothetical protein